MATHASPDSDMSIVYFSLMIKDKKKIIKAKKRKTIEEIVKSQQMKDMFTDPMFSANFFFIVPTDRAKFFCKTNI